MHELFYRYKICRLHPSHTVTSSGDDPLSSCTLPVVASYTQSMTAYQMVQNIRQYAQTQFLLERFGVSFSDIPQSEVSREQLLSSTQKIVQQLGGKYITSMDIIGGYLTVTEEQSRLLFNKNIKVEEIIPIVTWARLHFPEEERPKAFRMNVAGSGVGEALVSGWTLETQKYTKDFTSFALSKNPHLLGREKEFEAMQSALLKKENNNVLLIGEIGGGKEALVEKLALASFSGQTEKGLQHKKILELMVGPLIAGASDRGQLEVRLQALIEEISHARNIILYIPEFHDLLGSSTFEMDLSGALYPYLQDGNLPIIATITDGKYKQFLEGKKS